MVNCRDALRFACALGLLLAGCSPAVPSAELTGQVTVDGVPVADGTISFTPLSGPGTGVSTKIEGGKFQAAGIPLGRVRVDLHAVRETGRTITRQGFPEKEVVTVIPERYATGIEMDVAAGAATRDFALTTKP